MINLACLSVDSSMFGSERTLLDILERLDRSRFSARLILPRDGPFARAARASGLEVFILPWLDERASSSFLGAPLAVLRLAVWLRRRHIHIVKLNRLQSFRDLAIMNLAGRLARCRTVVYLRFPCHPLTPLHKLVLRGADRIVPIRASQVDPWRRSWETSALETRLVVIPDGRDIAGLKRLRADPARMRSLGIPEGAPVLGIVGRIVEDKRQDLFVRAAEPILRERPDARFVIVGSHDRDQVTSYVRFVRWLAGRAPLSRRVFFTGYLHDAPSFMKNFDVLLVPSEREQLGGVAIEAMAEGVPVVAHRVDGLAELLEHRVTGLLVDRQDPELYAAAALELLRDPDLVRRLTANAAREAERYGGERQAALVERVCGELLEREVRRPRGPNRA